MVFTRDWEDGLTTGQTIFGTGGPTHSVVGGRYNLGANANTSAISRFDEAPQLVDFDATTTMYYYTNKIPGFIYRTTYFGNTEGGSAYLVQIEPARITLYRGTNSTGTTWTLLVASPAITHTDAVSYEMRIRAVGPYHEVYENGVLVLSAYDYVYPGAGYFGFRKSGSVAGSCEFDNITITELIGDQSYRGQIGQYPELQEVLVAGTMYKNVKTPNPKEVYRTIVYTPVNTQCVLEQTSMRRILPIWTLISTPEVHKVDTTGRITGTVEIGTNLITDAMVRLYYKASGGLIEEKRTDALGTFRFDLLETDKPYYTVIAYVPQYNAQIYDSIAPKKAT